MTFLHPWMLLGTLAALLPLLIHLFDRRRPRPHPFGAIAFVLRSQRRTASRLKLKRLLLYILRTLILLALPIALARPQWQVDRAAARAQGPAATAIVLDASLSMRWQPESGATLFERGREQARDALKDLLAEEPATVLVCTAQPAPPDAPTFDRRSLRAVVDEAKPTWAPSSLNRCLDLAAHALEQSTLPAKRLVVISDFTAGALHVETPPPLVSGPGGEKVRPEVVLRDAAEGMEQLANHAIVDLKIEPATHVAPRAFQFTFTVRNFANEPVKDLEASLKVGDQVVAKGFLDLAAGGTAQKTLTHRFEGGGPATGEITLDPDALPDDDRRAFLVSVPKSLRALIVNGAPSTVRYRDEVFFVEAALTAPGSPVQAVVRDVDAAFREDFSTYDLVLLLNVGAPPPEVAARLKQFVEAGGGLFVSVGDQVEPEAFNERLGALMPSRLRVVKTAANPSEAEAGQRAARLTTLQPHPVFAPFTGPAREGLLSARFYRYMLIESDGSRGDALTLAALDDGAPLLSVATRGKGRVLLFTTTVDRDWSDFSIRTSFLPLMQRFCAFLAGALEEREELRGRVGESITLSPGADEPLGVVRAPSGAELPLDPQADGTVRVGPIDEPGPHAALAEDGSAVNALSFAAVLDPSESDLTRLKRPELTTYFGEESVRMPASGVHEQRVPLWTWLIVAAAMAFFCEGLLLRA